MKNMTRLGRARIQRKERDKISVDRCSEVIVFTLDPLPGVTPPLFAYHGGIERSRGKPEKHLTSIKARRDDLRNIWRELYENG
jgi:hypothetical protein